MRAEEMSPLAYPARGRRTGFEMEAEGWEVVVDWGEELRGGQ